MKGSSPSRQLNATTCDVESLRWNATADQVAHQKPCDRANLSCERGNCHVLNLASWIIRWVKTMPYLHLNFARSLLCHARRELAVRPCRLYADVMQIMGRRMGGRLETAESLNAGCARRRLACIERNSKLRWSIPKRSRASKIRVALRRLNRPDRTRE